MNDIGSLSISTFIIFGVLSIAFYVVLLRPAAQARPPPVQQQQPPPLDQHDQDQQSSRAQVKQDQCTRIPPHLASQVLATSGGSNVVVDGLVAFRYTRAAVYEQRQQQHQQQQDDGNSAAVVARKELARILARLDSENGVTPPLRGSTVVVSVPVEECHCEKLRRVLYVLATHFNLLVILAVNSEYSLAEHKENVLPTLRGTSEKELPAEVLPDHRIVAASSVAGRVAFVRQLQRVELVLDFDPEVKSLLSRFGHRVFLYGEGSSENRTSRLGAALIE